MAHSMRGAELFQSFGDFKGDEVNSPLFDSNRTLARPAHRLLSSQSRSQEIRLGRISGNVCEQPMFADQQMGLLKV